jgi:DNA-binding Lrp family transcriptional regulator
MGSSTVFDMKYLEDLLMDGTPKKAIANAMGVSPPTLRKIIANAQDKKTLLTQYRTLRNLHLTELQVQVLEAVTPDKIEGASIKDLLYAYKILRDKEVEVDDSPEGNLKGLVAHLLHLERLERDLGRPIDVGDISEAEYEEASSGIPQLPDPEGI